MTKQCPNCGTEIDNKEEICPNCGHSFKEDQKSEKISTEETNTEATINEEESSSSFLNKEQNENIEWSELKDMSIGHVMTMFNEQQEDTSATAEESTNDSEKIIEEKKTNLEDTAALAQYINDHKNEEIKDELSSDEKTKDAEKTNENEELKEPMTSEETEQAAEPEVESTDKGQDEVKPIEEDKQQNEKSINNTSKEGISKFVKPEEKPIGPKALPKETTEIPSNSKKPEEIEMDAAPIFFKDGEEGSSSAKDHFAKPAAPSSKAEPKSDNPKPSKPKNYKKLSIILAAVVVLAGGSWFAYSQTQKKSSDGTKVSETNEKLASQTEKELNSYFTDDKQLFIKPEMVNLSPKTIKENLDTLKDDKDHKKLQALYDKVTTKQAALSQVNELFDQPVISGNKLNDVAIKADKKVDISKYDEKDAFDKLINQGIDQAIAQYDQLQKAKAAVEVVYKDNQTTEALTRETYNAAKAEVDQVKSETLRKPLTEALAKADQALTELETANAAQQQAASAQASGQSSAGNTAVYDEQGNTVQLANGGQPDASTFTPANADGVYTAPVYTADANDVSDMSNPAWVWAPGIQDKVIATCIERGYITAGNYSLQPARIIDGEGYYNLYGGDGQYLVTINAKTGWFKGNASRNAGR
ncbi:MULTISPECIES: cell division site-positioning protein MapZ family protein [unclassified Enterococcus]|uniref:cell division site-positioning protein MapZ family protein n=1 Tax=unclassified Enterococcus TaxID=2608891 RepID=UPI001CE14370|nr:MULTISPECIES: cell division site-positioning protein MapZ family protein [unclassified Enterococcus]MCA5012765.1 zinc-ribbon domain-containing protein [Enterococcus sp. S23]MCA5016016.1 zinc-ribbon domain-containing protein [Enterococcus sp. S22(2020)]